MLLKQQTLFTNLLSLLRKLDDASDYQEFLHRIEILWFQKTTEMIVSGSKLPVDCSQSPIFPYTIVYVNRCVRLADILVSCYEQNWGEYKMPVGGGGWRARRAEKIFPPLYPHAINPTATTHGYFVLSLVSLASRDQDDGPSNTTIDIYDLTGK